MHRNLPSALSDGRPPRSRGDVYFINSQQWPPGRLPFIRHAAQSRNHSVLPPRLSLRPGCEGCRVITGIPPADSVSHLMHTSVWESEFEQAHTSCPTRSGVWQHDQSGSTSSKLPGWKRAAAGRGGEMGRGGSEDGLFRVKVKRLGLAGIAPCCLQDYFGAYWSSSWANIHSCVHVGRTGC